MVPKLREKDTDWDLHVKHTMTAQLKDNHVFSLTFSWRLAGTGRNRLVNFRVIGERVVEYVTPSSVLNTALYVCVCVWCVYVYVCKSCVYGNTISRCVCACIHTGDFRMLATSFCYNLLT